MKEVIDLFSGIGGFILALMSGLFGFLLMVLLILICLKKEKRKAVVQDFVLIINALRGRNNTS